MCDKVDEENCPFRRDEIYYISSKSQQFVKENTDTRSLSILLPSWLNKQLRYFSQSIQRTTLVKISKILSANTVVPIFTCETLISRNRFIIRFNYLFFLFVAINIYLSLNNNEQYRNKEINYDMVKFSEILKIK